MFKCSAVRPWPPVAAVAVTTTELVRPYVTAACAGGGGGGESERVYYLAARDLPTADVIVNRAGARSFARGRACGRRPPRIECGHARGAALRHSHNDRDS